MLYISAHENMVKALRECEFAQLKRGLKDRETVMGWSNYYAFENKEKS